MSVTFHSAPTLPAFINRDMPFHRRMADIDGDRIHFIDMGDGSDDAELPMVLLMHGNPTWCYLWRKVIKHLAGTRCRIIAPDLLGLGLSDKPRSPDAHRLDRHVSIMTKLVRALEPRELVVVGQDWGGPVATGVGRALDERVVGMVLANTAVLPPSRPFRSKPFHRFSHLRGVSDVVFRGLLFPVPVLAMTQGERASIGARETAAYAWPLRRLRDRAAPLGLARMVPNGESHPSTAALDEIGAWVTNFDRPTALVWGLRDPILGRALGRHRRALPHASVLETQAGHFLQEEVPDALADAISRVLAQKG